MNENIIETPESSEALKTLKAIHEEQKIQSKYLHNMYQIQVILFALAGIAFVVGFMIGTGAIKIRL